MSERASERASGLALVSAPRPWWVLPEQCRTNCRTRTSFTGLACLPLPHEVLSTCKARSACLHACTLKSNSSSCTSSSFFIRSRRRALGTHVPSSMCCQPERWRVSAQNQGKIERLAICGRRWPWAMAPEKSLSCRRGLQIHKDWKLLKGRPWHTMRQPHQRGSARLSQKLHDATLLQ